MLEVRQFSQRDRRFQAMLSRGAKLDLDAVRDAASLLGRFRDNARTEVENCLARYAPKDGVPPALRVSPEEMDAARRAVSDSFLTAVSLARVNTRKFHEHQRRKGYIADDNDGVILSRQVVPLASAGIYCGRSFATLLTHAVPAQIAGVGRIAVMAAPGRDGDIDPRILATARILGLDEVYRLSGGQAVAALAFGVDDADGTGGIQRVDKIFGADDALAGATKRLLCHTVGVDSGLGSGDLAIIADKSANARFVAGDLVAQAEPDETGQLTVLFTNDRFFGEAVRIEAERLIRRFPNAETLRKRLEERGAIYLCPDLDTAVAAVNKLAPARVSLNTRHNDACLAEIESAGAVYVGEWSAEAAGGYFSGVNPYLPVGGAARFRAGLGVDDFVREMTVVEFGPDRFLRNGRHQAILASEDGLPAQAETVRERLEMLRACC